MYSIEEKVQIVKWWYGGSSAREIRDTFAAKFPNRPIPCHATVQRVITKFEKSGTVLDNCKCNNNQHNQQQNGNGENEFNVLAAITENPNLSVREIGKNFDLHHTTCTKF